MIECIRLNNFKCFDALELDVGPLTILSGENSAGKSSVVQSLLLARSFHARKDDSGHLSLNASPLSLGTWSALKSATADPKAPIGISFDYRGGKLSSYEFNPVEGAPPQVQGAVRVLDDSALPPAAPRLTFVGAERLGPRPNYGLWPSTDWNVDGLGRDVPWTLETRRGEQVPNLATAHGSAASLGIRDQVEAWLGEITTPGVRLHTKVHHDLGLLGLSFSFPTFGKLQTDPQPATHVGFGLSYVLPILVAVVCAKPGDLLLIENPEAHLHPRAQRRLTELLVRAAASGVQVVVETHSDHVINGARLGIAGDLIDENSVVFQHFVRHPPVGIKGDVYEVLRPRSDTDGFLDFWPEGFFDEWEAALRDLHARRKQ